MMNRRTALQLIGGIATVSLAGCNATLTENSNQTDPATENPTKTSDTDSENSPEWGWTAFRKNNAHTGSLRQTISSTEFPLTKDWELTLDSQISTDPSIVPAPTTTPSDQQVTLPDTSVDAPILYFGTEAGTVHAVNGVSGSQIWETNNDNIDPLRTNPIVIAPGHVYILDSSARLHSIDAFDGEIQDWIRIPVDDSAPPSIPDSHKDAEKPPFGAPVATPTHLHAITGTRGAPATKLTMSSPHTGTIDISNSYFGSLAEGSVTPMAASPVATTDALYTGFHRWNPKTTEVEWEGSDEPYVDIEGVALVDGTVFTMTKQGVVYAFDAATGDQKWRTETGLTPDRSAAVSNGRVHLNGLVLDAETGREKWRKSNANQFVSTPAVTENTMITATSDGTIVALDASTGEELWSHDLDAEINAAPIIGSNHVYAVVDRTLYAFSL